MTFTLPATARAVLTLLTDHRWAAETILDAACTAGLAVATVRHLIRAGREPEAREMLERWADEEGME